MEHDGLIEAHDEAHRQTTGQPVEWWLSRSHCKLIVRLQPTARLAGMGPILNSQQHKQIELAATRLSSSCSNRSQKFKPKQANNR